MAVVVGHFKGILHYFRARGCLCVVPVDARLNNGRHTRHE